MTNYINQCSLSQAQIMDIYNGFEVLALPSENELPSPPLSTCEENHEVPLEENGAQSNDIPYETNNEKSLVVSNLIAQYETYWDSERGTFKQMPFDEKRFIDRITEHNKEFTNDIDYKTQYGFIEKVDVENETKIFVRADIHGDLKGLIENLKVLHAQGNLDENFRCKKGVHLVFLGDYMDRGANGVQVMELLVALKMANKGQTHLIRGNHEDVMINQSYYGNDRNLRNLVGSGDIEKSKLLTQLYQTMPLTLYIGQTSDSGKKEYVQFTHGLFEPHVDPAQILDVDEPYARAAVSKEIQLSERIKNMKIDESINYQDLLDKLKDKSSLSSEEKNQRSELKQKIAAKRIEQLVQQSKELREKSDSFDESLTAYNWADVDEFQTWLGSLGDRGWHMNAQDIKQYLRLSSAQHKVKKIFRGHEHKHKHLKLDDEKVVSTTLTIGIDTGYARYDLINEHDAAYLLTTASTAKEWTKQALLRKKGASEILITKPVSLYSDEV